MKKEEYDENLGNYNISREDVEYLLGPASKIVGVKATDDGDGICIKLNTGWYLQITVDKDSKLKAQIIRNGLIL